MPHNIEIDITVSCDEWPDMSEVIHTAAYMVLEQAGYWDTHNEETEISIVLTGNEQIRALNKTYRQKDKPTNVLSFPLEEPGSLGDVVLGFETVTKEAGEQAKSLEDHSIHLIVHGILHLLGLDHENDADAEEMEALEIRILGALGIKNPYEARDIVQ